MRWAVTMIVAGLLVLPASALAQDSSSSFSQLSGENGCVAQETPLPGGDDENIDGCGHARGLLNAFSVAVSPDDKHVYVASSGADTGVGSNAIVAFSRAGDTGALSSVGCVSDTGGDGRSGTDGFCTDGDALLGADSVAVSPDGKQVYVAAHSSNGIAWLSRDAATGALTPQACLLDKAPKGGSCTSAPELGGAAASAITPDGKTLLIASSADQALALFARDADTGAVTPAGCFVHKDPEGDDRVDTSDDSSDDSTADESQSGCKSAKALYQPEEVVVSPDGRGVFTLGGDSLAAFSRDPASGELTQTGCAEDDLSYKSCSQARGLFDAQGMAVSSDARSLYVANSNDNAVVVFAANVAIQSRAARVDRRGRFSVRLACPAARVRGCAGGLRIGATRTSAYRVRAGASRAVRARLPKSLRRAVRKRGHLRVKVSARDSRRVMRASVRRVLLRLR